MKQSTHLNKLELQEKYMVRGIVIKVEQYSCQKIFQIQNPKFRVNTRGKRRQCQSKNLNYVRECKGKSKENDWSPEEEKRLQKLYVEFGSSWSSFVEKFENRSKNCIKNKFYNKLRRACKKIQKHEDTFFKGSRTRLKYESIISLLQLCSQVQKWSPQIKRMFNRGCDLMASRDRILDLAFYNQKIINETEMTNIIMNIRKINNKVRSYGIFKTKSKKQYKLTEARIKQIINLNEKNLVDSTSNQKKAEFNAIQQNCQPQQQSNEIKDKQEQLKSLEIEQFEHYFSQNRTDKRMLYYEENYIQNHYISTIGDEIYQNQSIYERPFI